ncbi:small multidrug efflux protein [Herbiconiux sp. KACC 21604]|uniref:small multidrug efflux protein n=1 Tax=unclassified Herbiconiux TaxID=2618217 RepID=UPI0014924254|nr:small multidrug efflux protein [Herbiconiux sp. SALV-R1]QJU53379.1 small multidrug efflux protein [Herbiconiux sp. SALV-R1]WPO88343.1 small multidrug efflux protein [Herbiconiux sp. KACC 21604]
MDLISTFQDLVAQVPELLRPLIVALAGAVPFIEGEGAASIGIIGGLHPVVAVLSGAIGNFLCVTVLVLAGSGARSAVIARRDSRRAAKARAREEVFAGAAPGSPAPGSPEAVAAPGSPAAAVAPAAALDDEPGESSRKKARRQKLQRALDRYGVPGVSLLGPLLLPTQFTATMLAASGVSKARVLAWQAVAILAWSTLLGVVVGGMVHAVQ